MWDLQSNSYKRKTIEFFLTGTRYMGHGCDIVLFCVWTGKSIKCFMYEQVS